MNQKAFEKQRKQLTKKTIYLANDLSNKELISKIYKKYIQLNTKNTYIHTHTSTHSYLI